MSMTFSVNRVEILGRLGVDPDIKYTPSGKAVCKLKIATDRRVKNGDSYKDETEWHQVTLWDKDAEAAGRQLKKGSHFHVISGRLQTRMWEKDGQKHYTTEIVAELVTFPDGWRKDSAQSSHDTAKANGFQPQPEQDGQIPF